jgi:peptidoglycan/LPS O-acetylase OafA/YrhL
VGKTHELEDSVEEQASLQLTSNHLVLSLAISGMPSMKRVPSLDGLCAISIVLVVLGHLASRHYIYWEFWHFYANTGVRIFFVISGYLITQILLREQGRTGTISLKDFYVRRAFRIFPAAFVFLAIVSVAFWHELRWYQIGTALLYLASLGVTQPWFFMHLWSLSVEEQFYLLWPGVLRRWRSHSFTILTGVIIFAPFFSVFLYAVGARREYFATFPATADALAVGCVLAIMGSRVRRLKAMSLSAHWQLWHWCRSFPRRLWPSP